MRPSEGGSYVLRDGKLVRADAAAEPAPKPVDDWRTRSEAAQGAAALGDDPSKPQTPSGEAAAARRRVKKEA